jgi:hypothetical protein
VQCTYLYGGDGMKFKPFISKKPILNKVTITCPCCDDRLAESRKILKSLFDEIVTARSCSSNEAALCIRAFSELIEHHGVESIDLGPASAKGGVV